MDKDNVSSVQTVYNILEQTPGNELIKKASQQNVGILVRVPDASGILTGKVKAETVIPSNDHRKDRKMEWRQEALKKVEQFRPIAERNGLTIIEFAIKFILSKNPIASVLPTVVSEEEVESFAVISDGNYINSSDMKEIEELYNTWPAYELKATPQAN
jgi:aryl-alcohol dehydrogenase-like predicted oxidoreductase